MKKTTTTILLFCALSTMASAGVVAPNMESPATYTGRDRWVGSESSVVTPDMKSLAIYAGKNIWLGSGSSVDADIAAVGSITTGSKTQLKGLYTENLVWLSKDNKVNGRVLANLSAESADNLEFTGPSWTGKSVYMGKGANVTGDVIAGVGNLELNQKAVVTGNLDGNANLWIANYGRISGDASPGMKGRLDVGKKVTIDGSTEPSYADYDTVKLDSMGPAPDVHFYGKENVYGGKKAVVDLSAGDYRSLDLWGTNTQLNLSTGTYTLRDFWVGNEGTVNVDTILGDVVLNVQKEFSVGNGVTFNLVGDGQLILNVYDDVNLGKNVDITAQMLAWGGDVNAGNNLDFTGTILSAGDVSIGSGGAIYYGRQSPEPTTLALLGLGGAAMLWQQRRKRQPPHHAVV